MKDILLAEVTSEYDGDDDFGGFNTKWQAVKRGELLVLRFDRNTASEPFEAMFPFILADKFIRFAEWCALYPQSQEQECFEWGEVEYLIFSHVDMRNGKPMRMDFDYCDDVEAYCINANLWKPDYKQFFKDLQESVNKYWVDLAKGLCEKIENLPASEAQTAIIQDASALSRYLANK